MAYSYTYATMEVSAATYLEVLGKLEDAGYQQQIGEDGALDMHGIALVPELPDSLKDPKSVLERGRRLLRRWGYG